MRPSELLNINEEISRIQSLLESAILFDTGDYPEKKDAAMNNAITRLEVLKARIRTLGQ